MTRNYDAFTLAEVLITLVIIGVIAAMTIPTLINKTQNQEFVSRLKKTYSTLSQATNRIIAEEGTPKASIGGWAVDRDAFANMYKKYLSNVKECEFGQSCFDSISYNGLDGTKNFYDFMNDTLFKRLVLSDGTFINFYGVDSNCLWGQDIDGSEAANTICGYLHVDVNGQKSPNIWGRDAFRFYLTERGLFPSGCEYNSSNCKNDGHGGQACTCVVIKDNAMNY